jgi:hypothetical protein
VPARPMAEARNATSSWGLNGTSLERVGVKHRRTLGTSSKSPIPATSVGHRAASKSTKTHRRVRRVTKGPFMTLDFSQGIISAHRIFR